MVVGSEVDVVESEVNDEGYGVTAKERELLSPPRLYGIRAVPRICYALADQERPGCLPSIRPWSLCQYAMLASPSFTIHCTCEQRQPAAADLGPPSSLGPTQDPVSDMPTGFNPQVRDSRCVDADNRGIQKRALTSRS